jgi:type I restriction enzyme, S subunit
LQKLQKYKKTEFGEIPQEWSVISLREIALNFLSGGTPSTSNLAYWEGEIPWIRSAWITNKYVYAGERFITKLGLENSSAKVIPKDNVIVATRVSLGNIAINKIDIAINQDLTGIIIDRSKISPEYLYWVLFKHKQRIKLLSQGSTIPGITRDDLLVFSIPYPPIREQNRIASILSNIEELIQKTDQIIKQTQRLKNGLMQKLLTKGIGHKKFRNINWYFGKFKQIPDSWNYMLLDNVAKRGTGHTPDAKKSDYYNGGIKWVSLADSNCLDNLYISETTKEISQLGIENSSAVIHSAGTVIMSRDAGVGKSAIIKSEMAVSQHFVTWNCKQNLDNHYLYYLLQSWKPLFESVAIGTTIKTIGLPFFKKLQIPLPPLSEQIRIAAILKNIDFSIMKEVRYHSELKLLRKGLMQNLLTGKIRIKA